MGRFDGRVALVTGAASGIGRATALAFGREGAKVIVSDVSEKGGADAVAAIEEAGAKATFVRADVSNASDVRALVERSAAAYGGLDIAFNNAGIEGGQGFTADQTEEAFDRVIAVNLRGVWLGMKYEIPELLKRGGGAIVNNASILGLVGYRGAAGYVASKHAVLGLTKTAALEYAGQGVRVNAVCPAFVKTAMVEHAIGSRPELERMIVGLHPIGRMGTPEEIADAVLWLCSDGASFMTGQALAVDGGYLAQ